MRVGDSHVYQPNEIVPLSGWYAVLNAAGEGVGQSVYCEKENRFPPVQPPCYGYLLEQIPAAPKHRVK